MLTVSCVHPQGCTPAPCFPVLEDRSTPPWAHLPSCPPGSRVATPACAGCSPTSQTAHGPRACRAEATLIAPLGVSVGGPWLPVACVLPGPRVEGHASVSLEPLSPQASARARQTDGHTDRWTGGWQTCSRTCPSSLRKEALNGRHGGSIQREGTAPRVPRPGRASAGDGRGESSGPPSACGPGSAPRAAETCCPQVSPEAG